MSSGAENVRDRVLPGVSWYTLGFAAVFVVSMVLGLMGVDAPFSWLAAMLVLFSAGADFFNAAKAYRSEDAEAAKLGNWELILRARGQSTAGSRAVVATTGFLVAAVLGVPLSFLGVL